MKKFFLCTLSFVALSLIMAACGNENEPEPQFPEGAIKGKFTVDNQGTKVFFSKGNLQYNAHTKEWRFATNQWDVVGDNSLGSVCLGLNKCSNKNISDDYNGYIDLFGWGTGKNPTEISYKYQDYSTFEDWGENTISNGGGKSWRTLHAKEWRFIFHGRTDAENLFGFGTIDGIAGVFVLPDDYWQHPANVEIKPIAKITDADLGPVTWDETYKRYENQQGNKNFLHNTLNNKQWGELEKVGVVFLPAAGYRYGTDVIDVKTPVGLYWSDTGTDYPSHPNSMGVYLHFRPKYMTFIDTQNRCYGYSVRLARDVE